MENKDDNNKKYYEAFKKKHNDKINEKKICEICNGSYSYFNKSNHLKSQKHLNALQIIIKYKQNNIFNNVFKEENKE